MSATPEPATMFDFAKPVANTAAASAEMRNNFTALGQNNFGTDPAYPKTPRNGMFRINASDLNNLKLEMFYAPTGVAGTWKTLLQGVQNGYAAPRKVVRQFTLPGANPWVIDHNLGSFPVVQVLDAQGYAMRGVPQGSVPGAKEYTLQHVNTNRFILTFAALQDGYVVYIG